MRVEAVAFSIGDEYLLSMGGRDCGNVVVWDIQMGGALCGSVATRGIQGQATVLCTTNRRAACFLTAGDGNFGVWRINKKARNVQVVDVKMSKLKRVILCMDLNERDDVCFCGTSTGDVLKVRMNFHHDLDYLEPVKTPSLVGCFSKVVRRKLMPGEVELYIGGELAVVNVYGKVMTVTHNLTLRSERKLTKRKGRTDTKYILLINALINYKNYINISMHSYTCICFFKVLERLKF